MGCIEMPAGLTVYNNNNIVQINESYKNLQCYETGTTTNGATITISNSEILALRAEHGQWCATQLMPVLSGDNVAYKIVGFGTIYYYKFGYRSNNGGTHFEVRNSLGEVVCSDKPYMRVVAAKNGDAGASDSNKLWVGSIISSVIFPVEKKIAIVTSIPPTIIYFNGGMPDDILWQTYNFYSGKIDATYRSYISGSGYRQSGVYFNSYSYLVIDVTGL